MKCKSWLNEFNNFVVRKVKSIKINGQQQVLSNTMPAMPKEKSTPVSLSESNFSELEKMKEQLMMATSTQSNVPTSNSTNSNRYGNGGDHHHHHQQQQQQQQSHHRNSVCGCGAISAPIDTISRIPTVLTANSTVTATNGTTPCSTTLNTATTTCSRSKQLQHHQHHYHHQHNNHQQQQQQQQQLNGKTNLTTTTDSNKLSSCSSSSSSPIKTTNTSTSPASSSSSTTPPTAGTTPPKKSPNDFVFGKVIGEGSFSTVFLAMDVHTKREYAIKVCEKQHIIRERKQEYIRREREVMNVMTNVPGFVNLSCTFQDNRSLYFVMTIAKNGDLLPYINKVGSFDLDCTRHYAAELVLACENMHKRNIVHRDLKPENILLDENMHTLIADFGSAKILDNESMTSSSTTGGVTTSSTTTTQQTSSTPSSPASRSSSIDNNQQPGNFRRRKNSFVGTAQYVSPEVLHSQPIHRTADLWALGCIIYQMISGLPPFRGSNEFMIFKEILNCNLEFPEGFDKNAEDLVRKLLKLNPNERLGAHDKCGFYESIRSHPFFDGVNFDTIREQTPPTICPYLPGVSKDEELFRSQYRVPDDLEPGLGDRQLTRLLGMELGTSLDGYEAIERKTVRKNIFDLSDAEKQKRLEQQKSDKWHPFAKGEVILKKGFVNKRKGLFARRRMLLLTTGPRLIYIDPVQMIEKGEIPWSSELRVEPKNFKIFFVHTPDRTYYLDDPEGFSLQWVNAIENVSNLTYNVQQQDSNKKSSS